MHSKKITRMAILASGSSGNAALVQTNKTNILIDAGISAKRIAVALGAFNLRTEDLQGIVITHEHSDHIKGLGVLLKKIDVPLYCRMATAKEILRQFPNLHDNIVEINDFFAIGNVSCEAFDIDHDAVDPVGYSFFHDRVKVGYCTDLGRMTATVREKLSDCDILTLESNHDPEMLKHGPYPEFLKKRISGVNGHLSNFEAGLTLAKLRRQKRCTTFLAHLSRENNLPAIASETVKKVLKEHDICMINELDVRLSYPDTIVTCEIIADR
ncbi:MAG: MBL fold metallo-hydrolase [Negativicutes bacterium]|jgi:phosphoribosyl 1,2-cyclic phosphodiesterase